MRLLPLVKAVMAWLFLWLSCKKSVKAVISTMIVGNIVGNLVFAMAPLTNSRWMVLAARVILTSHEVQSVPNCYIGRAVGLRHRSEASMHNNAWFAMGFAAGPVLAYLLAQIAKNWEGQGGGVTVFDDVTLPAWVMAAIWCAFWFVHQKYYEEPPLEDGEDAALDKQTPLASLPWVAMVVSALLAFAVALTVSSWEMFTLEMAQDRWGSPLIAGGYLASVTMLILPVAMVSGRLSKWVSDISGVLLTFSAATLAWPFLFEYFKYPTYRNRTTEVVFFTFGSVLLLASMQFARGFVDALVSKLVPPDRKQQMITFAMSIFMLGRGVGGMFGVWLDDQDVWAGFHMSVCALTLFLALIALKFLHPHHSLARRP